MEFLRVDRDLLEAAAESSTFVPPAHQDRKTVVAWVKSLSAAVKDDAIAELVDGEPAQGAMELRARFSESHRPIQGPVVGPRRTAGELGMPITQADWLRDLPGGEAERILGILLQWHSHLLSEAEQLFGSGRLLAEREQPRRASCDVRNWLPLILTGA